MIGKPNELAPYILTLDKDKQYEIKEHQQKRSLNANDYMWVLCTKIAEVLKSTREEVYQKAIKEVGLYATYEMKPEAVDMFVKGWGHNRKGWVCELDTTNEDKTTVYAYYGSSVYKTKAMSVLLDYIVNEAEQLEIDTMTPNELANLKSKWGQSKGE